MDLLYSNILYLVYIESSLYKLVLITTQNIFKCSLH